MLMPMTTPCRLGYLREGRRREISADHADPIWKASCSIWGEVLSSAVLRLSSSYDVMLGSVMSLSRLFSYIYKGVRPPRPTIRFFPLYRTYTTLPVTEKPWHRSVHTSYLLQPL